MPLLIFIKLKSSPSLPFLHLSASLDVYSILPSIMHVRELLCGLRLEVLLLTTSHRPRIHRATKPVQPLGAEIARVGGVVEVVLGGGLGARDIEQGKHRMHIKGVARVPLVGAAKALANPDAQSPGVGTHEDAAAKSGDVVCEQLLHGMSVLSRIAHSALEFVVLLMELCIEGRVVEASMRAVETYLIENTPNEKIKIEPSYRGPLQVKGTLQYTSFGKNLGKNEIYPKWCDKEFTQD